MNAIARLLMEMDHMRAELQEMDVIVLKGILFQAPAGCEFSRIDNYATQQAKNRKWPVPRDLDEFGQR